MTLFFQLDLPESHPLATRHFVVFACAEHDDIWGGIYNNAAIVHPPGQLPAEYWALGGHYHLATYAGDELVPAPSQGRLRARPVTLQPDEAPKKKLFRIGGKAPYVDKLGYVCACGKPMVQLAEVPDDQEFELAPDQKPQANTTSDKVDLLFLGNYLLVMSCSVPCRPEAIVVYMVN